MKKILLATLASIIALAMMLPLASTALAQPELTLEEATAVKLGLAIQAPDSAKVGQPLKIRVVTRPGGRPVYRAQVWAININDIKNETADAEEYASLVEKCGYLLGWTNMRGYVAPPPRIWRAGKYVLVAIKPHFIPGFTKIKIEPRVPLTLRAPESAWIGQKVLMKVTEPVQKPVPRAAIFAIPLRNVVDEADQAEAYEQLLRDAQTYADLVTDLEDDAELNNIRRYLIGFTDRNGELTHRFWRVGPHLLITAKCGYIPDFTIIRIKGLHPVPAEPFPIKPDANS